MKIKPIEPPRVYSAGRHVPIQMKDCARVELQADEQVTFLTESGAEYDVARKSWGFYATPSLNGRLANFNLRAVLVCNDAGKYYVLLVEMGKEPLFEKYLQDEGERVVAWLDSSEALQALERTGRPA